MVNIEFDITIEDINYWEEIKEASSKLKTAMPTNYKELWVPGFSIDYSVPNIEIVDGTIGNKYLNRVCLHIK